MLLWFCLYYGFSQWVLIFLSLANKNMKTDTSKKKQKPNFWWEVMVTPMSVIAVESSGQILDIFWIKDTCLYKEVLNIFSHIVYSFGFSTFVNHHFFFFPIGLSVSCPLICRNSLYMLATNPLLSYRYFFPCSDSLFIFWEG